MTLEEHIFDIPSEHEQNVFGQFDAYLKKIERTTGVSAITRDGGLKLIGSETQVERAKETLLELLELSARGSQITEQNVDYAKNTGAEAVCGCHPGPDDRIRHWSGRHGQNLSCYGYGHYGI